MCGNKQMDMLSLLLGRSRPGGQVVLKVSSASLVRIVRDRTQTGRQRRGVGKTRCKHGRIIGHAAVVRRSCAGRVVEVFAGRGHSGTLQGHCGNGSIVAGSLRPVLGGGST